MNDCVISSDNRSLAVRCAFTFANLKTMTLPRSTGRAAISSASNIHTVCISSELSALTTNNKTNAVVGRDLNGPVQINYYTYQSECEILRLFGHEILTGYWRLQYNKRRDEYELFERFPDLAQIDAEPEWNSYKLNKISSQIVANPEMRGLQCFAPSPTYPIGDPTTPQCWASSILHTERLFAHQFFEGNGGGCWVFVTAQGDVVRGGFNYDLRQEWDGGLLTLRWDDQTEGTSVHCRRGSMFVVRTAADSAIFSFQCEDRVSGDQYLTTLEESERCETLSCPLWTQDGSRHKYMTSAAPTVVPSEWPTLDPSVVPTADPTTEPILQPTLLPTLHPGPVGVFAATPEAVEQAQLNLDEFAPVTTTTTTTEETELDDESDGEYAAIQAMLRCGLGLDP